MSDRIKGLLVAFSKDMRDDDCQCIIDAILMIKGVVNVTTNISDSDDWLNREQIRTEFRNKIFDIFK